MENGVFKATLRAWPDLSEHADIRCRHRAGAPCLKGLRLPPLGPRCGERSGCTALASSISTPRSSGVAERPRELDEESNRSLRLHPMPNLRDDDRARSRLDREGPVDRGAHLIAERSGEHVDSGPYAVLRSVLGPEPARDRRLVELRGSTICGKPVGPLHPVAAHAFELSAQHRLAPGVAHDPRSVHERRPVAHVLAMTASKIRDPVANLVEMKAGDRAFHGVTASAPVRAFSAAFRTGIRRGRPSRYR